MLFLQGGMMEITMNAIKLISLTSLIVLTSCQSMAPDQEAGVEYSYESMELPIINVYHNVHYNNPGFYPEGEYFNGGLYYMRGYRH